MAACKALMEGPASDLNMCTECRFWGTWFGNNYPKGQRRDWRI